MPDILDTEENLSQIFRDWGEIPLVGILCIMLLAWLAILAIHYGLFWISLLLPSRYRGYLSPWTPLLRLLVLIVATVQIVVLVIRPSPSNLLALLGAAGLAIGFAFRDYISSIIAGVVVLFERPYRVGDWVQIGDVYGEVKSLGLRTLELVTPDDTSVTIPHAKVWDSAIHDMNTGKRELQCVASFFVAPGHDGQRARERLTDVALTSPYLHLDRPVIVVVDALPWGLRYRIRAYPLSGHDQFLFITDLTLRGHAVLAALGVEPAACPAIAGAART
jgi:small conductance mechanosensitive channel